MIQIKDPDLRIGFDSYRTDSHDNFTMGRSRAKDQFYDVDPGF